MLTLEVLVKLTRIEEPAADCDLTVSAVYPNAVYYKTKHQQILKSSKPENMDYQSHLKL